MPVTGSIISICTLALLMAAGILLAPGRNTVPWMQYFLFVPACFAVCPLWKRILSKENIFFYDGTTELTDIIALAVLLLLLAADFVLVYIVHR